MRILGIDYGDARTGLAVSDPTGFIAGAIGAINSPKASCVVNEIIKKIDEYNVEKIVIGYPVDMYGLPGPRAIKTEQFVELLKAKADTPIEFMDERYTTASATRILNETNTRGKKRKGAIDTISASIILQNYLDLQRNKELK